MAYNKFTIGILFRIALIFGNLVLISYILSLETRLFTLLILFGILAIQVYELIYYVNKTNRELAGFLDSIKDKDLATRSVSGKDITFKKLNQTFNNVIESIQQASIERESHFTLLNLVVQQAQVGILLIDSTGKVEIMNPASLNTLKLQKTCSNISEFNNSLPAFYNFIKSMGNKTNILDLKPATISCIKNEIKLRDKNYSLITFQDISRELEKKEIESWQKLIRTLSHEIMNSVTPITSLTETTLNLIRENENNLKEKQQKEKLKRALEAIEKRSNGLYNFVNDVRKVIKIPEPQKEKINLVSFTEHILTFMENQLSAGEVTVQKSIPENLILEADPNQIEQVLINLILNSTEALKDKENPVISIEAGKNRKGVYLKVSDNGKGIGEEELSKIFIPFYSTRKEGSGIGLSLCRQIMQNHEGKLTVESEVNSGSTFTLLFF